VMRGCCGAGRSGPCSRAAGADGNLSDNLAYDL
jgi:hypothetical protein